MTTGRRNLFADLKHRVTAGFNMQVAHVNSDKTAKELSASNGKKYEQSIMHTIAVRLDRPCVIALRERENTSWNGWLNDKLKDVMGNQVLPCNGMLAPHNAAHAMKLR